MHGKIWIIFTVYMLIAYNERSHDSLKIDRNRVKCPMTNIKAITPSCGVVHASLLAATGSVGG